MNVLGRSKSILEDSVEVEPVLDFKRYSQSIAKLIRKSNHKFSVGIYGEWGTGKTTLMKLIEKSIRGYVFSWDKHRLYNKEGLIKFLRENLELPWIEGNVEINTSDESIIISKSSDIVEIKFSNDKALVKKKGFEKEFFTIEKEDGKVNAYEGSQHVLTVWFNAWRFEREEQFATIALMKTIAYAMEKHSLYKQVKPILLRGIKILGKDLIRQVASNFITEKGIEEFEKNLLPKMDLLAEIDKDTIYFDGLSKIEEEMNKIIESNPDSRVVVFIDDLDRCSPKRVIEVFESMKVFLDINGFVFVIGLSYITVSKLITSEYRDSGVKGEQYISKIIQAPIIVPEWNLSDINNLMLNLAEKIDQRYSDVLKENADLIAKNRVQS